MSGLLIRDPGPGTSVQDLGRPDARRWGVPVSGTVAPDWLRLANALVGNAGDAAGLEVRLMGPTIEVEAERVRVAAAGPVELHVEDADGSRTIPPWQAARLERGDRFKMGRITEGTTAVLAVSGGIDVAPVLGSRATYARARLGGLEGRALQAGDRLPLGQARPGEEQALDPPAEDADAPIHVVLGPQDGHFSDAAIAALSESPFTVSERSDRMGMRLTGATLAHRDADSAEIASDATVPGAIQVPGNGAPIVLLADGQTVGGYPKIATVVSCDLRRLATLAPGARVRFAVVEVARAEELARRHAAALRRAIEGIRPVTMRDGVDLARLYEANLVDGVVDVTHPDNFPGHLESDPA